MQPTTQASSKTEMLCAFHPSSFSSSYLATIGPSSSLIAPPVSMPGAVAMPTDCCRLVKHRPHVRLASTVHIPALTACHLYLSTSLLYGYG
ncbi:uncharacterized protein BO87DRAFT_30076 [Aspergillus neoniger CBS 115656]|uniref:Uncharacterized protein n=1 Tax=Aspergillus neoniger (strain CBS 115656) TaxID=1448310 RepID=A0A318ZHF1_ASPNB|nr:hypothetical protein BO87DRAFT_30076 [Aspergillus neoniger CBS 115656]PYH35462.1 hypothetical protein BO87DRAFT_30076 [Aspergillus neoniger CBS 115656]